MKQKLQIYNTNRAIVFTTSEQPLDPYLVDQIDKRFEETCSDALILGQGPVLSFGYLDPRDFLQTYPNNSSFAVSKDAYNEIGDIDFSLRSASAADYFVRLKENKKNISLAFDIIMPCAERRPNDVSDLWADSLLLDSKHGNIRVKVEVLQDWVNAVLHYDSGIGNYSRRNLIKRAPDFLFNYIKNLFYHKSNREEKIKYYVSSTLRGEFRLEESQPIREPLVSIVVRTCGRPDTLKLTLDSLRYQTYKNFEVIVVEDGVDTAFDLISREYSDLNVHYYATGENIGRAAAANVGFSKASGEWINMLDDDDYLYPEHLRVGLSAAETSGSDMVFLKSIALDINALSKTPYMYDVLGIHYMNFPRIDPFTMSSSCKTPNNGVLFKTYLLERFGGMRENLGANEDWELWLRFMVAAKYTVVDYATCAFVNPASEEERSKREEAYKPWRGMQFADETIQYFTSPVELAQYYLGLGSDLDALNKAGEMDSFAKSILNYYSMYNEPQLEKEYKSFIGAIESGETKRYSSKQFNLWYCAVCHHFLKMNRETRNKEIEVIKTKELGFYPKKKIHFAAFWPWFDRDDNFFLDKLNKRYHVIDKGEPDYLICSIFGIGFYEYVTYKCPRIFFSGENYSPDFNLVDYAMGYDLMDYPERYRRIPEYYVDVRKMINRINVRPTYEEALEIISKKTEFCNFIYGDSKCCNERAGIFHALNKKKKVCSAGKWLNNMENGFVADMLSTKEDFQRRCRFTIAVESYPRPGFVTEKLTDAFLSYSIPIYYGDPTVCEVFNEKAFIDVRRFSSMEELTEEVLHLENSPEEMAKMLAEPVFKDPDYFKNIDKVFEDFLFYIVDKNPEDAIVRPTNGQPEVHQNYIAILQKYLSSQKYRRKEQAERRKQSIYHS